MGFSLSPARSPHPSFVSQVDPARRIDVSGILAHPWVAQHSPPPDVPLEGAASRLRAFNAKRKVKVAALAAPFGPRQLTSARGLLELVAGRQFSFDELGALSAAFSRVAGAAPTVMTLAQFRQALALVSATAGLPADRLFALFDAGA